ncbi:synaptonemal complex central element protein 3 [Engraulis encrasicolus]|uniref:synaptonemal complex central element protein 3 n=1 Tax=Engraulis encrasicolus TaxID=184585 RepID=UPI002FD4E0C3
MTDSSSCELLESCGQETLQTTKELERMVEAVENMSVQLSVMAYDSVVLRTDPDQAQAMQRLQEAYLQCEAAVRPHLANPSNHTRDTAASDTSATL